MQEVTCPLALPCKDPIEESGLATPVDDRDGELLIGHTHKAEVVIPFFIDQRLWMQGRARSRQTAWSRRKGPLMKS